VGGKEGNGRREAAAPTAEGKRYQLAATVLLLLAERRSPGAWDSEREGGRGQFAICMHGDADDLIHTTLT